MDEAEGRLPDMGLTPFPVLSTRRLNVRRLVDEDAEAVYWLRSNQEAMKYIGKPVLKSFQEARILIAGFDKIIDTNAGLVWGIDDIETGRLLGTISYHKIDWATGRAEIGYIIHPRHWGKGYVSEVLDEVIIFGFSKLGLKSIAAVVEVDNHASVKVLLRQGFEKEGIVKEDLNNEGSSCCIQVYTLERPHFSL
ncbi:hypothetical protein DYBT9275_01089 [Dyadobacter sp. CECT 9275]|uniref:N-acetyltransferase domain-containing protein n=1 Tax=Dyadobacter helix TaxID=2822344 RepID=A0A916NBA4_9BACT|nr:GNAT family N-acetyltransferase [Dyadobacter sp. CECT 9275]CAG4993030.1 hypothetical protein DYBT9275_01089 [Dyadobacter sp. CECT 9275]